MKMTGEQLHQLMQKAQDCVFLSEIDINKITEEIFFESNRSLEGITYEELQKNCLKIYAEAIQMWDGEKNFEQFVKEKIPEAKEIQKLLILMLPQEE